MRRSYFLLHIAVILAGFTGIFGKLISLNEGLLVWYRVFFSAIWLFFVLQIFSVSKAISWGEKFKIARVGMLITIHWVFFYASIKYSNVSVGVVCFSLTSFFTALFGSVINRQRLVISEMLLSLFTLVGIALMFHFDSSYQLGIALGVVSSAFSGLFTIYNARLVKHYDTRLLNYYQMIGGSLGLGLLLPIYLHYFPVTNLLPDLADTIYLLLLSLFCTVGLYILFAESLKKIPAFTVSLSFNLEPIYAIVMAFIFFNEGKEVGTAFYLGLTFVATSVVLQTIISVMKKPRLAS